MNIVIVGLGKVGSNVAKQLSAEGYDITLIDSNPNVLEKVIQRYDSIAVTGNGANLGVLREAGVANADLLIAVANADEVNLLCCMAARKINPKIHTIARIRNPEYYEQVYEMRDAFGLSLTVNPERQAAHKIERLIKFPGFLKRDSFAKDRVEIVELKIEEDSNLNGIALMDLNNIIKCQVLVCTVLRDGHAIMPDGQFVLKANDRIFATAPTNELAELLKNLHIITHKIKKVLIVGGGRISYYLAQNLRKNKICVQIVEQNHNRCIELASLLPDADIIEGDASSHATLQESGMSDCDAMVSLTGLDEMNIVISLFATDQQVPLVITKLGHSDDMAILDRLPIGSIVCPKELSCNTIVRYVRAMKNQSGAAVSVHSIASGQAEAVEFLVDETAKYCKIPLKDVKIKKNVLIACITHNGNVIIPNGDSHFQAGDTVVAVTNSGTVLLQLNDIFEI